MPSQGGTIAQAYVQILPSAEGIKGKLTEVLGGEAEAAGRSAGGSWGGAFKSGLATVGKAAAAATAAAGAGMVALGKQALESYADYEQLTGGVETLFGDSADTVMQYAQNAYKAQGLSANAYMESVTSFSASLLQSLDGDTEAAAAAADMAITDMADNANKMGTSMESIQSAYQGFAKQNYSMLDNLKLGYGGTKEEMERLLADAEQISGTHYDIGNLSDVYEAIHVVQTEMGITGTTAKEAASTISGSVNAAKASWANLVTGIADENADIDGLIDNFVDSVITVGENLLPRVAQIAQGFGTLVSQTAERLIPVAVDALVQNLPMLIQSGVTLLVSLITGIIQAIPQLIAAIPQILAAIWTGLKNGWPQMKEAGAQLLQTVGDGLKGLWNEVKNWGRDLIQLFINGIKEKASALWDEVRGIASGIADFLHFSVPEKGPLADLDESPRDMMQMYADGIRGNRHLVTEALDRSLQFAPPAISTYVGGEAGQTTMSGNVINISCNVTGAKSDDDETLARRIAYAIKASFDREASAYA